MSVFDEYFAAVASLGGALVNAAEGALPSAPGPEDPDHVAQQTRVRDAYIIARVDVAVAEALAKQAVSETADNAKKLVQSAALFVGKSEQQLLDAAAAAKASLEADVSSAYKSAVDLGYRALKGVHDQAVADAGSLIFGVEIQTVLVLGALGAWLWWENRKQSSPAAMRRTILANEA